MSPGLNYLSKSNQDCFTHTIIDPVGCVRLVCVVNVDLVKKDPTVYNQLGSKNFPNAQTVSAHCVLCTWKICSVRYALQTADLHVYAWCVKATLASVSTIDCETEIYYEKHIYSI